MEGYEKIGGITELSPHVVIAEYIERVKEVERERLKEGIKKLCDHLSEKDIVVPINFIHYGDTLYSEVFDSELYFLISCGIVNEKKGSIIYEITQSGEALLGRSNNIWNVPDELMKIIDSAFHEEV